MLKDNYKYNKMQEKKTRGGYRPGSGRKPTVKNVKTLSIRIPQDVSDILDEQPNRSQYIAEAVRFYHQQRQ
jgi:hypothetical protein